MYDNLFIEIAIFKINIDSNLAAIGSKLQNKMPRLIQTQKVLKI
jgi:hypothetical protein